MGALQKARALACPLDSPFPVGGSLPGTAFFLPGLRPFVGTTAKSAPTGWARIQWSDTIQGGRDLKRPYEPRLRVSQPPWLPFRGGLDRRD